MEDIKEHITITIQRALEELEVEDIVVEIEIPRHAAHGDYSTNVALLASKALNRNPRELASELVKLIEAEKSLYIEKVDIAGPGFINFWIAKNVLIDTVKHVISEGDDFGKNSDLAGKKVMVEYTDPNPFKEFHMGHLYSNAVGESIARIFEANSAEVKRVSYQGDVGLHVAKSIWGMKRLIAQEATSLEELHLLTASEKAKFLGRSYALGATKYEEEEKAKAEIIELNKKIFAKDPEIRDLYSKGKSWSLEYFDRIYARLGTIFWKYYFESEVAERGTQSVQENLKKGIFEESEGAVIFPGKKHGLHNRVFINSVGLPTYEAKELGLAPTKYDDFSYDLSIIITGNEVDEYFKVLLKALELIHPNLAERTRHISHGMVKLPDGKMSSRTGKIITGESILDEAHKRARQKIDEVVKGGVQEKAEKEQIAEIVGVGAVKYALLKNSIGKDIKFDFDEVVSFEGNSGPYLQYVYVRTRSILEKAGNVGLAFENPQELEQEEEELLRTLAQYPMIVREATFRIAPSDIASYLFTLSQVFNNFYEKHPILQSEKKEFRVALTFAVGQVLKNGLAILGIKTVERM